MRSGSGLTSDEVARRALASSPELERRRYATQGTEEAISQTKYAFWPRATLSAGYTRLSEVDIPPALSNFVTDIPNSYQLSARLSVPISDYLFRMSDAVRGASRSREASRADAAVARGNVAFQARVAYYQWIRAQAFELISLQRLELGRAQLADVTNAFQAGLVSKADVLAAEARVKSAELAAEQSRNATALAALGLSVIMHDSGPPAYEVGEDFLAEAPELSRLPSPEAAYREALATRAELRGLGALSEAIQAQANTEQARGYPRLDASAGVLYANPNQRYFPPEEKFNLTWDAGVVLSWTPTDIGGANASANVAELRALELKAQAKAFRDALRQEVEQALKRAAEARFAIGVTTHGLAAAEESYRVRRELYRAGRAPLIEVTNAETELTAARLQMADSHIGARVSLAELRHALGRDQRDGSRRSGVATDRNP
jgi:outer membrane protein TolC